MSRSRRWVSVAACSALALGLTAGASAPGANAAPRTDSAQDGVVRLKEGQRTIVSGRVPAKFAGQFVAFDVVDKSGFQRIDTDTVGKKGEVRFAVNIGGDGDFRGQFRVIRGGKAVWSSKPFDLKVTDSGRGHKGEESADRISDHADASGTDTPTRRMTRAKGMDSWQSDLQTQLTSGVSSATSDIFKTATKDALGDIGSGIVGDLAGPLAGFGMTELFGLIWPTGPSAEMQELSKISTEIQNGFAEVNGQLNQIERDLAALQSSVDLVRQELSAVDEAATEDGCIALLDRADGYVTSIREAYSNYALVQSPGWLNKNVAGQSAVQARKLVGEQLFGMGSSGTPSYSRGVIDLRQSVEGLRALLAPDAQSVNSLVAACAVAAQAAVVNANSSNDPGTVIPLGSVEKGYFERMQAIVTPYTSWLELGQVVVTQGELMVLAELTKVEPGETKVAPGNVCQDDSTREEGPFSCSSLKNDLIATRSTTADVFQRIGASWAQVSGGLLVGDARVDSSQNGIQWPRNAWVKDLASYAAPVGSRYPALSSLKEADSRLPQAAYTTFATKSAKPVVSQWMGATFSEARNADWEWAFPVQKPPLSRDTVLETMRPGVVLDGTVGEILGAAGLKNNGQNPENLLLYTGDTFEFLIGQQGNGISFPYGSREDSCGVGIIGALTGAAFVDVNAKVERGKHLGVTGSQDVLKVMPYTVNQPRDRGVKCYDGAAKGVNWMTWSLSAAPIDMSADAIVFQPNQSTPQIGNPQFYPPKSMPYAAGVANKEFYRPLYGYGASYANDPDSDPRIEEDNGKNGSRSSGIYPLWPEFLEGDSKASPEWQYVWPVLGLQSATKPCALTEFGWGAGGVCQDWFNEYAAGALGVPTGPVSVAAAQVQGTDLGGEAHAATVVVSNDSDQSQTVTISAEVPARGAVRLGNMVEVDGSRLSVNDCTAINATKLTCSVQVPPRTSEPLSINLQKSYSSSTRMTVSLAGSGSWDSVRTTVIPSPTRAGVKGSAQTGYAPPAGLVGRGSTISEGGDERFAVDLTWGNSVEHSIWDIDLTAPDGSQAKVTAYAGLPGRNRGSSSPQVEVREVSPPDDDGLRRAQIVFPEDYNGPVRGVWTAKVSTVMGSSSQVESATTTFIYESVAKPMAPRNLVGDETPQGGVRLSWVPVHATPVVSDYTVTATSPSGKTRTVTTSSSSWELPGVRELGTWEFTVIAENAVGISQTATTAVIVKGWAPKKPTNLRTSITQDGWISLEFDESSSVPAATEYVIGLFAPGEKTARATATVPIPEDDEIERIYVNNLLQLSTASPTGTWRMEVVPTNTEGPGQAAGSSLYVSAGTLAQAKGNENQQAILASIPDFLTRYAKQSCTLGLWDDDLLVFGTCDGEEAFMPAPDLEEPTPDPEGSWVDELPDGVA